MQTAKLSWFRVVLVAFAAGAAVVPLPPSAVDRLYTAHIYATLQPLVTSLSNLTSVALLDLAIALVALAWTVLAVRDLRRAPSRVRACLRVCGRTLTWSATIYLLFLVCWGLNYRRPRMRDTLPYDASGVTPDAVLAAGRLAVERLNALHDRAHASESLPAADAALADGFARAVSETGISRDVVPARPKRSVLDWYFRRAGVDGMTDPLFLETLVVSTLLPFERDFVVAHEWSHLAGIADEGEANFAGWLACMRGSPANQYSGWLFLYGELARAMPGRDRDAVSAALAGGPRADLRAIRDRYTREVDPRLSAAGWRVYDSYLKANRIAAGAASYDEVVRLVLGVRLSSGLRPLSP